MRASEPAGEIPSAVEGVPKATRIPLYLYSVVYVDFRDMFFEKYFSRQVCQKDGTSG